MKRKLDFAIMIAIATLVTLVVGCDNLISGDQLDWDAWMSCPGAKKNTTGDLIWLGFDIVTGSAPLPGDKISLNIMIQNSYDLNFPENPNIPLSSNLRVFMEDTGVYSAGSFVVGNEYEIINPGTTDFTLIGAASSAAGTIFVATDIGEGDGTARDTSTQGIGTVGPEDWFLGEFVVPGLFADKRHVIVENVTIPRTNHFPTVVPGGDNAPNLGPEIVHFTVYGVLDAQDCIGERDENNNQIEASINGAAGTLDVTNPYLPNLQIKYLQRTPTSPLPPTGGVSITEWEILNAGIGPVKDDFDIYVFLSEDGVYDKWDEVIGMTTVTDEIAGNTNMLVYLSVSMPYVTWRNNGWSLYSSLAIYDPAVGDDWKTREPPMAGPPGYNFTVYPCIKGGTGIIALVDPNSINAVREAIENDNYSYQGTGGNGTLEATNTPAPWGYDINLIEFRADNYMGSGGTGSNTYDISVRYDASIQFADNCSFGFYWSKDDTASFGDYFCQRYWFLIQPGTNLLYPFGASNIWRPDPIPAPGSYRMVLVLDDIYKFDEPDEDNNVKVSIGTVQVS